MWSGKGGRRERLVTEYRTGYGVVVVPGAPVASPEERADLVAPPRVWAQQVEPSWGWAGHLGIGVVLLGLLLGLWMLYRWRSQGEGG